MPLREVGSRFADGRVEVAEGVLVVCLQGGLRHNVSVDSGAIGHDNDGVIACLTMGPFAVGKDGAGIDG